MDHGAMLSLALNDLLFFIYFCSMWKWKVCFSVCSRKSINCVLIKTLHNAHTKKRKKTKKEKNIIFINFIRTNTFWFDAAVINITYINVLYYRDILNIHCGYGLMIIIVLFGWILCTYFDSKHATKCYWNNTGKCVINNSNWRIQRTSLMSNSNSHNLC